MSKLTDLLKKRQALIQQGTKAFDQGRKAFESAARIDEQILNLVNRARDILGDGPVRPKQTPKQRALDQEVDKLFTNEPPRKPGRTPRLQEPIREVLEKNNNHPMTQDAILAALEAKGVTVQGKRPKHTLSAHVSYLIKKQFLVRTDREHVALKQALLIQPRGERTLN